MKIYSEINLDSRIKLQKKYSDKAFLTVEETGIWLELHPNIVRKYLKSGDIVGTKLFGSKYWRINVQKTKEQLNLNA